MVILKLKNCGIVFALGIVLWDKGALSLLLGINSAQEISF